MKTTTIINIQIFIQTKSNKAVDQSKLSQYIKDNHINAQAWYYQLLTLHSFQVDTELKMLENEDIWSDK